MADADREGPPWSGEPVLIEDFVAILEKHGELGKNLLTCFQVGGMFVDQDSFTGCCAGVFDRNSLNELIKGNVEFTRQEQPELKRFPLANLVNIVIARCSHFFPNFTLNPPQQTYAVTGDAGQAYEVIEAVGLDLLQIADEQPTFGGISNISFGTVDSQPVDRQRPALRQKLSIQRSSSLRRGDEEASDASYADEQAAAAECDDGEQSASDSTAKAPISPRRYRGWGSPIGRAILNDTKGAGQYANDCRFMLHKNYSLVREKVLEASIKQDGDAITDLKAHLSDAFKKDIKKDRSFMPSSKNIKPKTARLFTNSRYHHRATKCRADANRWHGLPWVIVNGHRLEPENLAFFFLDARSPYYDLLVRIKTLAVEPAGIAYVTVIDRGFHEQGARHVDPVFEIVYPFVNLRMEATDFCVELTSLFEYNESVEQIVRGIKASRGSRRGHCRYILPNDAEEGAYLVHMPSQAAAFREHLETLVTPKTDDEAISENGGVAEAAQDTYIAPAGVQAAVQVVEQVKARLATRKRKQNHQSAVPSKRQATSQASSSMPIPQERAIEQPKSPIATTSSAQPSSAHPTPIMPLERLTTGNTPIPRRGRNTIQREVPRLYNPLSDVQQARAKLVKAICPILKCKKDWAERQLYDVEACRDRLHGPPQVLYLDLEMDTDSNEAKEVYENWRNPDFMASMIRSMRRHNKKHPLDRFAPPHTGPLPPVSPVPETDDSGDGSGDDGESCLLERLQQRVRMEPDSQVETSCVVDECSELSIANDDSLLAPNVVSSQSLPPSDSSQTLLSPAINCIASTSASAPESAATATADVLSSPHSSPTNTSFGLKNLGEGDVESALLSFATFALAEHSANAQTVLPLAEVQLAQPAPAVPPPTEFVPAAESVHAAEPVPAAELVVAAESVHAAEPVPAAESVLAAESVHVAEPVPAAEFAPAAESVHVAEPVPAAEFMPAAESVHVAEPVPAAEFAPAAESVHVAEPVPTAEFVPAAESLHVAEPVPAAEPVLAAESVHAAEPVPTAESVLAAESVHAVESVPTAESVLAAESLLAAEPAPAAKSVSTAESVLTAEMVCANELLPDDSLQPSEELESSNDVTDGEDESLSADEHLQGLERSSSLSNVSSVHPFEEETSFEETLRQFDAGESVMGLPFLELSTAVAVKVGEMTDWDSYQLTLKNAADPPTSFLAQLDLLLEVSPNEFKTFEDFGISKADLMGSFEFIRRQYVHLLGEEGADFEFKPIRASKGRWQGTLELKTLYTSPKSTHLKTTPTHYRRSSADRPITSRSRRSETLTSVGDDAASSSTERRASIGETPCQEDGTDESGTRPLRNSMWELILFTLHEKLNSFSDGEIYDKFIVLGGWESFVSLSKIPIPQIRSIMAKYDADYDCLEKMKHKDRSKAVKRLVTIMTIAGHFRLTNVASSDQGFRFVGVMQKLPV